MQAVGAILDLERRREAADRDAGVIELAEEADHIVRVIDGGTDHPSNLRVLCQAHHAERHS
ncbi:MAG: HNH endonuclease signature motif containing protein [Solirubrobacteraceae bacterium]